MSLLDRIMKKYENESTYKVENLYIGLLGFVTGEAYRTKKITYINRLIIFRKNKFNKSPDDYIAENIFTEQKYFFFHGNKYDSLTIDKAINGLAIYKYFPLEMLLTEPKLTITKNELLQLYYYLNFKIHKRKDNEIELTEPITDSILQTILKTKDIVAQTSMSRSFKKEIIKELEDLGKYYIDSMIKYSELDDGEIALEGEYTIKMECMKKLVEIESKINNPNIAKTYSLTKQFNQFKKDLNNE